MEKTLVFTHRLDLALRLIDTASGRNVRNPTVRIDGAPVRFGVKEGGVLVFQNLGRRQFRLEAAAPDFEEVRADVDLDALNRAYPLLEIHMIPGGGEGLLTLSGTLPGITALFAVRAGDNGCLIREFDVRKRQAKLFNPHRLTLDRLHYALVDPDRGVFEPFRIVRLTDGQTVKTDRVLEMPFRNYFPVSPMVLGRADPDGRYCLRVRDEGERAVWYVRWESGGEARFQTVDFRASPRLEAD